MNFDILHETIKPLLEKEAEEIEIFECNSEFSDTESFCNKYNFLLEDSCNAILIKSKKPEVFYSMFCVLGHQRLDVNKKAKDAMNTRRASFASKDMTKTTARKIKKPNRISEINTGSKLATLTFCSFASK